MEICWSDVYNLQAKLKAENERLKKENEILLGQLVINDGEDVTVQISKSQFDEYNKYRKALQEIKAIAEDIFIEGDMSNTYRIVNDLKKIIAKVESEGVE